MFQELLVVPAFGQQMSSTPIYFDILTQPDIFEGYILFKKDIYSLN